MEIVIKIPKEFEEHFKSDRFEDSLARVASDIESFGFQLAGRYEKETITMLREAFKNCTPLPKGHGRIVDINELMNVIGLEDNNENRENNLAELITLEDIDRITTIIEADGGEEDDLKT